MTFFATMPLGAVFGSFAAGVIAYYIYRTELRWVYRDNASRYAERNQYLDALRNVTSASNLKDAQHHRPRCDRCCNPTRR